MPEPQSETLAVVGLGYVGLPVALAFAKKYPTIGFDVSERRIRALRERRDETGEVTSQSLAESSLELTSDPAALERATFIVVAVPTPIDSTTRPDLGPVLRATETVGAHLRRGAIVVYESTVYPGVTEEICGPLLASISGLECGRDFALGYSPERINPGDQEHTFVRITKVVSAQDERSLDRVAAVYGSVVEAGVHRASSIRVAEAAKVIENTQRDLNIALMNELALIFDRLGISTREVLEAAATKWNFLRFSPGLVGGHCIGVDPYYLTTKAQEVGYQPEVILAGRRINNSMPIYVARRAVKMLSSCDVVLHQARVGICGVTFKENVPDLRNSRVPDIVRELREFGIEPLVHDPLGDREEAKREYGVELADWSELRDLDGIILAVAHRFYADIPPATLLERVRPGGVVVDVKSMLPPAAVPAHLRYWSL